MPKKLSPASYYLSQDFVVRRNVVVNERTGKPVSVEAACRWLEGGRVWNTERLAKMRAMGQRQIDQELSERARYLKSSEARVAALKAGIAAFDAETYKTPADGTQIPHASDAFAHKSLYLPSSSGAEEVRGFARFAPGREVAQARTLGALVKSMATLHEVFVSKQYVAHGVNGGYSIKLWNISPKNMNRWSLAVFKKTRIALMDFIEETFAHLDCKVVYSESADRFRSHESIRLTLPRSLTLEEMDDLREYLLSRCNAQGYLVS